MTLREKIVDIAYDLSEHQIQGVKDGFVTDFKVEEAIEAILSAIEESLPEKSSRLSSRDISDYDLDDIYDDYFAEGFNSCLTQIKAMLKEKEK